MRKPIFKISFLILLFTSSLATLHAQNVGIGTSNPQSKLQVLGKTTTDDIKLTNVMEVDSAGSIKLGANAVNKETNAGRIGYQLFSGGGLDIVGAGKTVAERKITLWAEGGVTAKGAIKMGAASGTVTEGTIQWNPVTKDFEGFNGTQWISLTQQNAPWGQIVNDLTYATETQKITAPDAEDLDQFGFSLDFDGDYVVIGAPNYDMNSTNNIGAVYVYLFNGSQWIHDTTLISSNPCTDCFFGKDVAIHGEYLVIGAPDETITHSKQGAAYVMKRNGSLWSHQAKLTASDPGANVRFGKSVAIHNNHIGAGTQNANGAYSFSRSGTTWSQIVKLTGTSPSFGSKVKVKSSYIFVTEPFYNGSYSSQGLVQAFLITGQLQQNFVSPHPQNNAMFGNDIEVQNYNGAFELMVAESDSVHFFMGILSSWTQPSSIGNISSLSKVSLSGDNCIISNPTSSYKNAGGAGILEVYRRNANKWSKESTLVTSDYAIADELGRSIKLNGNKILAATYFKNFQRGAVYAYFKN